LASADLPKREESSLRRCASAGEALPAEVGRRWSEHFGVDILDGLGSTEMLHIFLSNRPEDNRYGTSGKAVPGYDIRLVDEEGKPGSKRRDRRAARLRSDQRSVLLEQPRKELQHFSRPWTKSGDKYSESADGYFTYGGRADDMLKVSGIWGIAL
jgi:benzoate-CoA ligase